MKWLGLAFGLFLFVGLVGSAPRVRDHEECNNLADMALVARAAAIEQLPVGTTGALFTHIYRIRTDRIGELAGLIIAAAYKDKRTAQKFAQDLIDQCARGGNLDSFLGAAT